MLGGAPRSSVQWVAFERRLRELGYVEGQNLVLEFRTAEGKAERFPDLAAALVQLNLDVLVVPSAQPALRAARQATSAVPIVMIAIDFDPIAQGYIAGLARPGGNITGVSLQQLEVTGKRLELLKNALPRLTRVAVPLGCLLCRRTPRGAGGGTADGIEPAAHRAAPAAAVRLHERLPRGGRGACGSDTALDFPSVLSRSRPPSGAVGHPPSAGRPSPAGIRGGGRAHFLWGEH